MTTAYTFDEALKWLKGGRKITRGGWNGKGMYIYMVRGRTLEVGDSDDTEPLASLVGKECRIRYNVRVDMRYADGSYGIWTPTIEDLFADDWNVLV